MLKAVQANKEHMMSGATEPLLSGDQIRELGDFEIAKDTDAYIKPEEDV